MKILLQVNERITAHQGLALTAKCVVMALMLKTESVSSQSGLSSYRAGGSLEAKLDIITRAPLKPQ